MAILSGELVLTIDPESRRDPRSYNLSEIQLSYLLGQDIGSRRESNLKTDVRDVVSNLDLRIQYLIEDIALFYSTDHLGSTDSPLSWDDLTDINRHDEMYDPPMAYNGISRDEQEEVKLAIHFGHILHHLHNNLDPEVDETKIAMGVLIGLNGGMLKDNWSGNSSIESFLGHLPDEDEYFESFEMPDDETLEMLETVLADLDEAIKTHPAATTENPDLREQLAESSLTQTEPLIKEARSRLEDAGFPPYASIVDTVIEEQVTSDAQLQALEKLCDQLNEDIAALSNAVYRGGAAIDVFYAFYTFGEYTDMDTGEIADAANTETHQVRKLRNDLLGSASPWSDRPLLFEDQVGYTPTDYGFLVGHLLNDKETPVKDEIQPGELVYSIPSRKEIATTCHRYLLGEAGNDHQELIESVLEEQFLAEDQSRES